MISTTISNGHCFPDLQSAGDAGEMSRLETMCRQTQYFEVVSEQLAKEDFLPVQSDASAPDSVLSRSGWFPHRVHLELKYWQRKSSSSKAFSKELLQGVLLLRDFNRPPSTLRGHEYDMRISLVPVDWMGVFNQFALSTSTYVLFYVVIDAVLVFVIALLWGVSRGCARKRTPPPRLHFFTWLKGFELNPAFGFAAVALPLLVCCLLVRYAIVTSNPFGVFRGDMKPTSYLDAQEIWLHGRVGICLLAVGFNLMCDGAAVLCPRNDMPGSVWRPGYWQRRHVMYTSCSVFVVLLLALEVSFSTFFARHPLAFMLLFKGAWIQLEAWLVFTLTEKLLALPFECALQSAQLVFALGADGFSTFILVFVVETAAMMAKRVVVDPLKFRLRRILTYKLRARNAQRVEQSMPANTPELEAMGLMIDMISLMYRFSIDSLASAISPVIILVLYLFREQFEIHRMYGIRSTDLIFFMLFAFIVVPALWLGDIFLFNVLELLWNWKLFEYVQFCHQRFANRSRRWIGFDPQVNEGLPPDLRAMDQMCLSMQLYQLGSLHAIGIVVAVLGYVLILHQNHNMFGDPLIVPIVAIIWIVLATGKKLLWRVADRLQAWAVEGESHQRMEEYGQGPSPLRCTLSDAMPTTGPPGFVAVGQPGGNASDVSPAGTNRFGGAARGRETPPAPRPLPSQASTDFQLQQSCSLDGVAVQGRATPRTFPEFMAAFRQEMRASEQREKRNRFVASSHLGANIDDPTPLARQHLSKAGVGVLADYATDSEDLVDAAWPDELMLALGVSADEPGIADDPRTTDETEESTSTTADSNG